MTKRWLEFNGERRTLDDWSGITGLSTDAIRSRLAKGWTVEDALTKPRWLCRRVEFSKEELDEIIESHVKHHEPPIKICKRFGCSAPVIVRVLSESGVYRPIGSRRYFFNENYFEEIDTPRKAYWLGLIYADGCVTLDGLIIGLKIEDRYILEALAVDIGYDGSPLDYKEEKSFNGAEKRTYYGSRLTLCSQQLVRLLAKWGVVNRKTFRLTFPHLPSNLRSHFVRGLFDGDGCISITQRGRNKNVVFNIVGCKDLLEVVNEVLVKEAGVLPVSVRRKGKENVWELRMATSVGEYCLSLNERLQDFFKIREWLYKDADIYLNRKKAVFDTLNYTPTTGLSIEEAADLLGIGQEMMRHHVREKHIPSYKEIHYRRLAKEDVEELGRVLKTGRPPWRKSHAGESNNAAKLTEVDVKNILEEHRAGGTCKELAREHGVSDAAIRRIVTRRGWGHVK